LRNSFGTNFSRGTFAIARKVRGSSIPRLRSWRSTIAPAEDELNVPLPVSRTLHWSAREAGSCAGESPILAKKVSNTTTLNRVIVKNILTKKLSSSRS
jgi:hypothetical protein